MDFIPSWGFPEDPLNLTELFTDVTDLVIYHTIRSIIHKLLT